VSYEPLTMPDDDVYSELKQGSGEHEVATTMAFVRQLKDLLKVEGLGARIVPIIPDEARTFGMDSLFPTLKLYDPHGQTYESVDRDMLLSYQQAKDGQILHEGITEAGSMGSFHAVGTSYATHGEPFVPVYIFYSMFGFQRTADLIWSAADQRARGFLIGATAGGTTLTGEGLQHLDRHSHLFALSNPAVRAYDPSFAYEISIIVQHALEEMYGGGVEEDEDRIYYLTVYNEPAVQPAMPDHVDPQRVVQGMYRFRDPDDGTHEAHILSSGTIMMEALRAQRLLAEDWDVAATVWSCPGWNQLLRDGGECDNWNRTHPDGPERVPMVTRFLEGTSGVYVAVTDWMKATPTQIADWIPGPYAVLGTDGFGRSDTREKMRRFHLIDAESTVVTVLGALATAGTIDGGVVRKAIEQYGLDVDRLPYVGWRDTGDVTV
jgi:pyruvate dehydrogenase E1 component